MRPGQEISASADANTQGTRFTRRSAIRAATVASLAASPLLAAETAVQAPSDFPILAVWHSGGHRMKANDGLKIAVWADGAILISPRPEQLGDYMVSGAVDKADLDDTLKAIAAAGFFELKHGVQVPDSSFTTIAVRDKRKSNACSFHEYLLPGFGGDLNTDAAYRQFVRTWRRTWGAIESLAPARVEPLGDRKEFRDYSVERPFATPWRDATKWKAPVPE